MRLPDICGKVTLPSRDDWSLRMKDKNWWFAQKPAFQNLFRTMPTTSKWTVCLQCNAAMQQRIFYLNKRHAPWWEPTSSLNWCWTKLILSQWCFMLWPAAWFDVSPQRFEILPDRILSLLLSLPVALFPFPSFTSRIVPSVPSLRVTSPGSPLERLLGLLSIPGRLYSSWRHQWPGLASCGRHLSGHLRHPNSREWMGPAWSGLNIQVLNQASLMFWFDLSPSSSLFLKRLLPCYKPCISLLLGRATFDLVPDPAISP